MIALVERRFMARRLAFGVAVMAAALGTAAVADAQTPDQQPGSVRVVHGLRGLVADIYLDGTLVLPTFQPERSTDPLAIPAGEHLVEIRAAGAAATEQPLLTQTVTVPAGFQGSLVAHLDSTGNPTLTAFADDLTAVPAGESRVVVRHAAAADDVAVLLNEQPAFPDVAPKAEATDVVGAGAYQVSVTPVAGGAPLAAPQSVQYADGTANHMYLIGSQADGTLGWAAVQIGNLQTAPVMIQTGDGSTESTGGSGITLALVVAAGVLATGGVADRGPPARGDPRADDAAPPGGRHRPRRRRPRGDRCGRPRVGRRRAASPRRRARRRRQREPVRPPTSRPEPSTTTTDAPSTTPPATSTSTTIVPIVTHAADVGILARSPSPRRRAWRSRRSRSTARCSATGVNPAGELDVPPDARTLVWYRHGPTPGAPGSAVIAGHLNWKGVEGIFSELAGVPVGAEVIVTYDDGTQRRFVVRSVELVDKPAVAVNGVFARDGESVLRLVTCGGEFDDSTRHYRSNVVLTAVPA